MTNNSACDSLNKNLTYAWNSYVSAVDKTAKAIDNYFSNSKHPLNPAYVKLVSTVNDLSNKIAESLSTGPTIAELKKARATIDIDKVPFNIKPGKVIPQFYQPIWISNDQMCSWKVESCGQADGRGWGNYYGKQWGISDRQDFADSFFITHWSFMAPINDKNGPYYWLMERVPRSENPHAGKGGIPVYVYV